MLLWPTSASVVAVVRTHRPAARDAFVALETLALSGLSVAPALVGALRPRVQVIAAHHTAHPGEIFGTNTQRAVRTRPLHFAIDTREAFAVHVLLTTAVARAVILAEPSAAMPLLVPC